jgi:hypothetical protein
MEASFILNPHLRQAIKRYPQQYDDRINIELTD